MKMIVLSEQSPEYNKDVLVKLSTGHFTVAKLVRMYEAACGEWEEWYPSDAVESYDDNHAGTVLAAGVIEWCELPE
jgi:hypothetical protein